MNDFEDIHLEIAGSNSGVGPSSIVTDHDNMTQSKITDPGNDNEKSLGGR